jgi:hypothetical protein
VKINARDDLNGAVLVPLMDAFPGTSAPTLWRWRQKGWLETVNISGRQYCTQESIMNFKRRAAAGEFAQEHVTPKRQRG